MKISHMFEASPSDEMRAMTYYHGTTSASEIESIRQNGLRGRETQGRSHLAPVQGRVYLTPHISYAIMYALGGNFSSSMVEAKDFSNPYGYLFVIRGSDLVDVQPDEDSIGEWMADNAEAIKEPWVNKGKVALKPDGSPHMRTTGYKCGFAYGTPEFDIWQYLRSSFTPKQFDDAIQGFYSAYAAGGKRSLKKMPDWMKIKLINMGAHVAHGGSIIPSETWRIEKKKMSLLKKDGSNFFQIAEQI